MPVDPKARPAAPAPRRQPAKPVPPAPAGNARKDGLAGYAQLAQLTCVMRGWYADAGAVSAHAPRIITEIVTLADTREDIGRAVDYLCAAGPYTALITAVLPLALQIAANHGRIDATRTSAGGILPPDVLEKQVRNEIALMQLEAAKKAEEARSEIQRITESIEAAENMNGNAS